MCKFQVNVVKRGEIIVEADTLEQAEQIAKASPDKIKWNEDIICEEIHDISVS